MSLPTNNKNDGKQGGKSPKNSAAGNSKFIAKSGNKTAGAAKKPVKTGGSRGS